MKLFDQEKWIDRWEENGGKYEQSDGYLGLTISGKNRLRRESQGKIVHIIWPVGMFVWDCLECLKW